MNLRETAHSIFQAALHAADPTSAILNSLHRQGDLLLVQDCSYDLSAVKRLLVVGFGKAGAAMAKGVELILGERIFAGRINVKYGHTLPLEKIVLQEAGHPLPDENSLLGTQKILELLETAQEDDLVLCLISGGGSALLELPASGITAVDLRTATDVMLRAGADIYELNTLRKHLSQVKGGQLARCASKARMISLILSDVIGSPLDGIASGPTVADPSTFAQALQVVELRGVRTLMPPAVLARLEAGKVGDLPDTPKADDPIFRRVQNVIIADNTLSCEAALRKAQTLGYQPLLLSSYLEGEASEVAKVFAAIAKEIRLSGRPIPAPAFVLAGGETTVTVRGRGKGGRNQELALAASIEIAGMEGVLVLSGGTDGTDGPTDAAGAVADGKTLRRAEGMGLSARSFLAENDSYSFFQKLGDLLITGPTHTNVNDIILMLVA